jgi:predicted DNA-binding protein (MmcQ/YjbR family)
MDKQLQRERLTRYMQDTYATEAEYLWADTPDCAVFRHPSSKKWYAIIMTVRSDRLGLSGEELVDVMNVKCGAIMTGSLLSQKGFLPAYHMNKNYWISILLNDSVPDDQIAPLLELSYNSVAPKRKRKKELANDAENPVGH